MSGRSSPFVFTVTDPPGTRLRPCGNLRPVAADLTDPHGLPLWPAPERNKRVIADLLRQVLPENGVLLEIASGTGQHALHFVEALPGWTIQPSECDPGHLETLRRRVLLALNPRLLAPLELDVLELDVAEAAPALEPMALFTAIYCANMLHIAPWAACHGLFAVGARLLRSGGLLVTYGPYSVRGEHTAESNDAFDRSLRERNPAWGVRDVTAVEEVAREQGFVLAETHAMPANNLTLVWRREGRAG